MITDKVAGFRLSLSQSRFWLTDTSPLDAMRSACRVRIEGRLDPNALERALADSVRRHEALRLEFERLPGMRTPVQTPAAAGGLDWAAENLPVGSPEQLEEWARGALTEAWQGGPDGAAGSQLRARLCSIPDTEHVLILSAPAAAADVASLVRLVVQAERDVRGAQGAEEQALSYLQFSEWQREVIADPDAESSHAHWKRQMAALSEAPWDLPFELADAEQGFAPGLVELAADAAGEPLTELARREEIPERSLLAALWCGLLGRYSRTQGERASLGLVVSGREYEVLEGAVGPFEKVVPIHLTVDESRSWLDAARSLERGLEQAEELAEAFVWGSVDGSEVQEDSGYPTVVYEPRQPLAAGEDGLASWSVDRRLGCCDRFRLKLAAELGEGVLRASVQYDRGRYEEPDMARLAAQLEALIAAALADPEVPLAALNGAPAPVRAAPETFEAPPRTVLERFEEQVGLGPSRPAVRGPDGGLTYGDLDLEADRLARRLAQLGAGPEERVAVFLERSSRMLVAILGAFKAGCAYVVLDPSQPAKRLEAMTGDCGASILVTERQLVSAAPELRHVVVLDDLSEDGGGAGVAPGRRAVPDGLAYVVFTSGSTGRPKGVAVGHRAAGDLCRSRDPAPGPARRGKLRHRLDLRSGPGTYRGLPGALLRRLPSRARAGRRDGSGGRRPLLRAP